LKTVNIVWPTGNTWAGKRFVAVAELLAGEGLQEIRRPDCTDQERQFWGVSSPKWPVRHAFDPDGDQDTDQSAHNQSGEDQTDGRPSGRDARAEDAAGQERGAEAAPHEHVTVGEVDETEHTVDERVADRDHRVERAVLEPDEEVRPKTDTNLVKSAEPEMGESHARMCSSTCRCTAPGPG
jgi:hypothetical protein